jgi:glutamyl-tRNA synthetase
MDWGNAIVDKVTKSPAGVVTAVTAHLHLDGDFRKTKKKLTWLPALNDKLTPVVLTDYDYLITKKKLEEDDKFEDFLNPKTEYRTDALGDANLKQLKKGDIIQLERRGYFICDAAVEEGGVCRLISVPDGRAASIALKYTGGVDKPAK